MPIITVENLSKYYLLYHRKWDRIVEAVLPFTSRRHTPFAALEDITFSIARGESVGIAGVNGSGKSTLLKLLTGVLTPSKGSLSVGGRVAALLELGAGFHPERTGRENIYFLGALQGFSKKEVDVYLPDVLDFADIGDFCDQPVKLYSSGMFVRLAFAAAIQGNPDILIIDEALAVGDVMFQRKCFQKIEELKKNGTTFIFVSHVTEQIVTHCTRALLLSQGKLIMDGEPRDVVNRYMDFLFDKGEKQVSSPPTAPEAHVVETQAGVFEAGTQGERTALFNDAGVLDRLSQSPLYNPYEYRWGSGEAKILDVLLTSSGNPMHICPGDRLALHIKAVFLSPVIRPIFGITVKTREGVTVFGSNSEINESAPPYERTEAGEVTRVTFSFACNLAPGEYFLSLGIARMAGEAMPLDRRYDSLLLTVHGPAGFFGLSDLSMRIHKAEEKNAFEKLLPI